MSLPVVATITAKPGSESVVRDALEALVVPTRGEDGCLSYVLHQSVADPTVFITVELWREQSDLDAHMQTAHVSDALTAAGDHLAAPPAIHPLNAIGD